MTEPEGLPDRVTRLEREMIDVRADAKIARLLAAGADHDVSEVRAELRGHRRAIEALRATQLDHGRAMHEGFAEMHEKFAVVGEGMEHITTLLTTALNKPDTP